MVYIMNWTPNNERPEMSTDYIMHVHRKCDDKEIAQVLVNMVKNIIDYDDRFAYGDIEKTKFEISVLEDVYEKAKNEVWTKMQEILSKNLLIAAALNTDVANDLKEDIEYIRREDLPELYDVMGSAKFLLGQIHTVVEDSIKPGGTDHELNMAYMYNVKDLEKPGENSPMLFVDKTYFTLERC